MMFRRIRLSHIALFLGSVVVTLALLESSLRLFPEVLTEETRQLVQATPDKLGVGHPYIGHLHSPHSGHVTSGRDFRVANYSDGHGFRNAWPWPDKAEVVAVGDSLTVGHGVTDEQNWPAILARALHPNPVMNLGLSGAGPQQYARIYETFGRQLRPNLLLVGVFLRNDFWDADLFDRWLRSGVGGNYLVWRDFGRLTRVGFNWRQPGTSLMRTARYNAYILARKSYLFTLLLAIRQNVTGGLVAAPTTFDFADGRHMQLFPGDLLRKVAGAQPERRDFELVLQAFRHLQTIAAEDGTRILLILQPSKEEVYLPLLGEPPPDFAAPLRHALEQLSLAYLDLTPIFRQRAAAGEQLFFEVDGHPNVAGYALIAEAVLAHLKAHHEDYGLVSGGAGAAGTDRDSKAMNHSRSAKAPVHRKINFVNFALHERRRTSNPPGWQEYDGTAYRKERGYGWLTDLWGHGLDGGRDGLIILPDGTTSSPAALGRLELANWQGAHPDNRPLVFRIDLPDGWYRVTCTSVDPRDGQLPLVDQRSIKFRAHDVVFAGSAYGEPLKLPGNQLVEGSQIVEVTDGHLRIVVGDPAYGGWTWSYQGPFWQDWGWWWRHPSVFAHTWYDKITRVVDPGFHSLRLNALEVEQVAAPARRPTTFFREFFNRNDHPEVNAGLPTGDHWVSTGLHPGNPDGISAELSHTALKLTGPARGAAATGLVQQKLSPEEGIVRYSTSVSLFTGEGSRIHSGIQEAGLLILGAPHGPTEFDSTFIGVAFDKSRGETPGWVKYRVGNGRDGYRTNAEIPDTVLPFKIAEGEYEIIAEHDVGDNMLKRIQINGVDITGHWAPPNRQQRLSRGWFGIRALMDAQGSGVRLQQFYWFYRVEEDRRSLYSATAG